MPLLNTTQRTNARIAELGQSAAAHLASAAVHANAMVTEALTLSDDDLTAWLNSHGPEQAGQLFGAHAMLGEAINGALQVANGILAQSGIAPQSAAVDTRSVPEKLAGQRRTMSVDPQTGEFAITTTPPEPDLEPEKQR